MIDSMRSLSKARRVRMSLVSESLAKEAMVSKVSIFRARQPGS